MKVASIFAINYALLFLLLHYLPKRGTTVPFAPAAALAIPAAAWLTWKWSKLADTREPDSSHKRRGPDKMAGVSRFEALARPVVWLTRRNWGLSFLLSFVSFWMIIGMASQHPTGRLNALFEGPIFRLGIEIGAIIFPDYTTRGTNGFYAVPLFGAAMDFLALMTFWLIVIVAVRRFRVQKAKSQHSLPLN